MYAIDGAISSDSPRREREAKAHRPRCDHIVTFPDGCRSVVSAEEFEREWEIVPDGLCDDIEARFGKLFEPT